MKNLIIILFILFGFSASAQDVTVIHFNYKWNDRNSYNIRGLKNAKLQYAWLEEQPESVKSGIKTVPVVVILKNGKVKGQFAADLSFEIKATREEIQDFINKVVEDK
jgi:hypothetical protein|tara:strand:+ start:527 stop:847 length:321 start_codon:yes stop_codon:yes gene_type:complete